MAAYTDSAIDYNFTVEYISVASNYMRVLYQSADSTDGRPEIRKNFRLEEFNDSAVLSLAKSGVPAVVSLWNTVLQNDSNAAGFNPDSYPSIVFSERYKPLEVDSEPSFNAATHYLVPTDSETNDRIIRTFVPTLHDSDTKSQYRESIRIEPIQIRALLEDAGKYDSVQAVILADSNDIELEWEYSGYFDYYNRLAPTIRSVLGYPYDANGDSDWTQFLSQ